MLGSDYSAQEVRVFAASSHDSHMIKTYEEGKDLYADVASRVFKVPYEQCLEFNPITKEMQVEGKARRTKCKSLILGLLYGRGITSIAEQIKSHKEGAVTKEDIEEAKQLSKDFFDSYPEGKAWIDQTHADVKKYGYVEDLWGRRRRLPDINLPKFTFKLKDEDEKIDVNPFLFTPNIKKELNPLLVKKYEAELSKVKMKADREKIIKKAADEGLVIIDNSGYIAQAERQSVNARIQGGSATITKLAMRNMDNDEELNILNITDPDTTEEDDLKDSYVGNVILECEVCHSPIFKNVEDVVIDEDSDLANIEDECPICHSNDGFTIIGQVAPYQEEPELEVEIEDKEISDDEVEDTADDEVEDYDDDIVDDDEEIKESLTEADGSAAEISDEEEDEFAGVSMKKSRDVYDAITACLFGHELGYGAKDRRILPDKAKGEHAYSLYEVASDIDDNIVV